MTARVIQGFFAGGGPRPLGSVAQPKTQHHAPSGPPVPAFAGRALVMQPRQPGPPAPAFAGRSPVVQPRGAGDAFPVDPARLGLANGGGRPLPDVLRGRMEAALGADFSAVRVHVGPQAERIGAIAFTLGSDIYFAPGRFQPDTAPGQQLLGHELAHVVQQRQGRVRNPMGSGVAVVQDRALEAEADRLGQRAATSPPIQAKPAAAPPMSPARPASPVRISAPIKAGPASYRLTAGTEGRQIGSVMVHARDKASVEVTDLGVDPAHREHGIGKLLLASAARTGLQSGKSKVTLAAQDNGSGHLTQWYKGMGFTQTGVNQRGYPQLEAPIGRVLAGTAQRQKANHAKFGDTPLLSQGADPSIKIPTASHREVGHGSVVQRMQRNCFYCLNPMCVKGSICGGGQSLTDLFGAGIDLNQAGLHRDTKQLSQRGVRESEHMLPMQVVRQVYPGASMNDEPAHSISYTMHRAGQSGAGGGISSTGSSHTASGWAGELVNLHNAGNSAEMFRRVAVDTYNSAELNNADLPQTLANIRQVLLGHVALGRLTRGEADQIYDELVRRYFG
jgi:GNAT superfamily N-acetyltransferase